MQNSYFYRITLISLSIIIYATSRVMFYEEYKIIKLLIVPAINLKIKISYSIISSILQMNLAVKKFVYIL